MSSFRLRSMGQKKGEGEQDISVQFCLYKNAYARIQYLQCLLHEHSPANGGLILVSMGDHSHMWTPTY